MSDECALVGGKVFSILEEKEGWVQSHLKTVHLVEEVE
jgi:hypothetical protein